MAGFLFLGVTAGADRQGLRTRRPEGSTPLHSTTNAVRNDIGHQGYTVKYNITPARRKFARKMTIDAFSGIGHQLSFCYATCPNFRDRTPSELRGRVERGAAGKVLPFRRGQRVPTQHPIEAVAA